MIWTIFESLAVVFAIAYLLLAIRQSILCWYAAAISVLLFMVVLWQKRLLMDSALQIYYLVMAGYGWWCWRQPKTSTSSVTIQQWPFWRHILILALVSAVSLPVGWAMANWTEAKLPYLDTWTTLASIITTWMVVRKLLESWLYWVLIDSISIYLYWDRELYQTMVLFIGYVILAVFGWYTWNKEYKANLDALAAVKIRTHQDEDIH